MTESIPVPGAAHKRLDIFIGKWLNEGHTIASADAPAVKILTSDIYEWMPGGFFVLHTAYGRIGDIDVGGVEIIGYDAATKTYRTHFFLQPGPHQFPGVDRRPWGLEMARRVHTLYGGLHGPGQNADGPPRA